MSTRTKDRRQSRRVTARSSLVIETPEGAVPASLKNVSMAGIACTTRQAFSEMADLQVRLELPALPGEEKERRTIEARCAVVRCQPLRRGNARRRFDLALYFTELDEPTKTTLAEFIRTRLQD